MYTAGNILEKQQNYYAKGLSISIDFRLQQLKKLKNIIETKENLIFQALKADLGKSNIEAYLTEVGFLKSEIKYMIKNLPKMAKPRRVRTPLTYPGARSIIYREPLGVVLIMAPWNYPFLLLLGPMVGAIAAGNCAVLKPSEYAPATSAIIREIITDIYPPEYIAVIEGNSGVAEELIQQKFDYIFFTGSPAIGRLVMAAAAKNLTPVTLELGGKSPCIVEPEVNVKYAARRIVWGKFLNAGQTCVAPDYLLVNRQVKNELTAAMVEVIRDFYGESPLASDAYSRIINKHHYHRLKSLLQNGRIIHGGDLYEAERYIGPTIVDNVSLDDALMQEEIFGPILPVIEYEKLSEAVYIVQQNPKPLALYFFSDDRSKQEIVLNRTNSGGVCINDCIIHITSSNLPFGGTGESGIGSYHGKASFTTFSHSKSVMKNTLKVDFPVRYPPYKIPLKLIKRFMEFL